MIKKFITILYLAFIGSLTPAQAQFGGGGNTDTQSSLISSATSIAPGESFHVALKLVQPSEWHSYYNNDGIGISQSPSVTWTLPDGFTASELIFPTPHTFDSFGFNSFGYEGTHYFYTKITASADLTVGDTEILSADASWQICKENCIMQDGQHSVQITISSDTVANPAFNAELADYQKKYIPAPETPASWTVSVTDTDSQIKIKINTDKELPIDLKFYEYNGQLDAQKPIDISSLGNNATIKGVFNEGNDFKPGPAEKLDHISGVLHSPSTELTDGSHSVFITAKWPTTEPAGDQVAVAPIATKQTALTPQIKNGELPDDYYLEYDTYADLSEMAKFEHTSKIHTLSLDQINDNGDVINDKNEIIAVGSWQFDDGSVVSREGGAVLNKKKETTFIWALIGIFGGGLILNLMPCVFPVLGIKVLGFVQLSGNDPKKIKMHGIVFTIGVVVSMWILAGILLSVKAFTGEAVAWGAQMQNPFFVGAMIILLALFALNLYGVFEVGTSLTSAGGKLHAKKGYEGSFFSGMLTTLIATPCGAPFLASAMAYTLQQTAIIALILFTVFALGVAAPYLILSFAPKLINKLPKPGAWMITFKKSMSFLLLATCAYFLSTFVEQTGKTGIKWMLWSLVVFSTAAFIYGTWSSPFITKIKRWTLGYGLSLIFAIGAGYLAYTGMSQIPLSSKVDIAANQTSLNSPAVYVDDHGWKPWNVGKVDHSRSKGRIVWMDYTASW